jgi:hypothetical protein
LVLKPTKMLGSFCRGRLRRTASNVPGAIFAAHPAAFAMDVSLIVSVT